MTGEVGGRKGELKKYRHAALVLGHALCTGNDYAISFHLVFKYTNYKEYTKGRGI